MEINTLHDKSVRKNRETLVRYFYSLLEQSSLSCLCAKQEVMKKFTGSVDSYGACDRIPSKLIEALNMSGEQYYEMECRYEGWYKLEDHSSKRYKKHSFSQIADWLQTLPRWPRVL